MLAGEIRGLVLVAALVAAVMIELGLQALARMLETLVSQERTDIP